MQLGSHNASVPGKEAHSDGNLIDVDADGDDLNEIKAHWQSPLTPTQLAWGGAAPLVTRTPEPRFRIPCRHLCRGLSKGLTSLPEPTTIYTGHLPLTRRDPACWSPFTLSKSAPGIFHDERAHNVTSYFLSVCANHDRWDDERGKDIGDGAREGEMQRCASRFLCLRSHFVLHGESDKGTRVEIAN